MKHNFNFAAMSLALAALFASGTLPADAAGAAQPDADAILRAMSSKLAAARQFTFDAHRQIDPALVPGHDLPADAHVAMTVQRPNKIATVSSSDEGDRHFYADGRNLTLFDVTKNLYATVPMHTSIDGLVAEIEQKYGFTPPLAELALSNVYEDIRWKAQSISYLGEGTVGGFLGLGGIACHRLMLSGKALDAELWVGVNDQLPHRLIATAKSRLGKPQIKVEFSDWNLAAKTTDQDFVFVAPKGAMKISMATIEETKAPHKKH